MKTKVLIMAMVAVFAFTSTTLGQNQKRGKRDADRREAVMKRQDRVAERMDSFFTDEQQEKIEELKLETAQKIKPLRNELNELQARQRTLSTADDADLDAIYENIDKISEARSEMQKIMAKQHQDIRSMLTEEQLLKYDAMKNRGSRGIKNSRFNRPSRI